MFIYSPRLFVKDFRILFPLVVGLVFQIILWVFTLVKLPPTSDAIYLHYNIIFGIDLVGPWSRILIPPAVGALALIINFVLAIFLYSENKFFSRLLVNLGAIVQILIFIGQILIIRLNV